MTAVADRVRETSSTTGTGTLSLLGAVTDFRAFSSAFSDGTEVYYCIELPGTGTWEVGVGTYNTGTLSRDTVLASSNAGALVNFAAGTKNVFCTLPARAVLGTKADVAAHATTANPWVAGQVVLTGGVVTFTDIADAPYAGAVVWVKQNAAHVWTDGAVFDVQGGANYTAAAGDWIRIYATTVSTFEITVFSAVMATQAMQEAGANVLAPVTPGRQQFHPSAAKAWAMWNTLTSTTLTASYNVASLTDNGTGYTTVVLDVDFSSINYSAIAGTNEDAAVAHVANALGYAAGSIQVKTYLLNGSLDDVTYANVVCFGDQG